MQIGQAQVVRSDWYDRAPLPIAKNYVSLIGPHLQTQRISYVVPANRVLKFSSYQHVIVRGAAATTVGFVQVLVQIYDTTPALVGNFEYQFQDNTMSPEKVVHHCIDMLIPAGYEVRISTIDGSVGGLIRYALNLSGTEYNA